MFITSGTAITPTNSTALGTRYSGYGAEGRGRPARRGPGGWRTVPRSGRGRLDPGWMCHGEALPSCWVALPTSGAVPVTAHRPSDGPLAPFRSVDSPVSG